MTDRTETHDLIQRGIELERRAGAGDKRAEWDLVALDRQIGVESQSALTDEPEHGGRHRLSLVALVEYEGLDPELIETAITREVLKVTVDESGERFVREREWERFRHWCFRRAIESA